MQPDRIWNVVTNPAWRPLTNADLPGYAVLLVCAVVLVGLTLWTYLGETQTTPRRLAVLIFLRMIALVIALLTALRPALSVTDQPRLKSTLVIVLDCSESMSITDEYDKLSRWEVLRRVVEKCDPLLKQLEADQEVTVHLYCFSNEFNPRTEQYRSQTEDQKTVTIADWLRSRKPDGKRTDFGGMLAELSKKYSGEQNPIRGLIVISDGGNNISIPDPLTQAKRWSEIDIRSNSCPIYCFLTGRTDTKTDQKDIGFTSITVDPTPVPVKVDMTVKADLKASGLEGSGVKIKLTVAKRNPSTRSWDDLPDLSRIADFRLFKPTGNQIEIVTKAPDKPGQIRVTLEIISGPAEDRIQGNNRIQTFVTVTKEGLRVLVIDRLRQELKFMRYALATDRRFQFEELIRQTDDVAPGAGDRKPDVLNEAYDVIVLGDVSPDRLNAIDPNLIKNIAKLVTEKGVGLLMMGGIDSFGGTPGVANSKGWKGTPIADLLPVILPEPRPQADGDTQILPLPDAFDQYIMKLDSDVKVSEKLWAQLGDQASTRLGGFTEVGRPKQGARVYANARRKDGLGGELPLLVGHTIGNNARVLAFGADQTWKWVNLGSQDGAEKPEIGSTIHARFWKQVALWLAHQDEVEGEIYVKPELSRLAVNGRNNFKMGVRDKQGQEVLNPKMRYIVLPAAQEPDEKKAKPAERKGGLPVGFFEPKEPGEYRVFAWADGAEGNAEAWFDVYPEVSDELFDPAAKDLFLLALEKAAVSSAPDTIRKADKLPAFIQETFLDKPLKETNLRPKQYPDWRRGGNPWFLPVLLIAFVTALSLEWGLRRVWGMI